MRKTVAILLTILTLFHVFGYMTFAEYIVGDANSGDTVFNEKKTETPFEVDVIYRASRYAVDVEYSDLNIYVESAVWNVNTYEYEVTMADDTPEFTVTVINHSDLSVGASISATVEEGLSATQRDSDGNSDGKLMIPAVTHGGDATSAYTVIAITANWQTYINSVISKNVIENGKSVVGAITLVVSKD